jgi:hypothetical protein
MVLLSDIVMLVILVTVLCSIDVDVVEEDVVPLEVVVELDVVPPVMRKFGEYWKFPLDSRVIWIP